MPEKSDFTLITVAWVAGLSVLGGVISFMDKVSKGMRPGIWAFVKETLTAGFVGLVSFMLCFSLLNLPEMAAGAIAGVSGHFSAKSLHIFEDLFDVVSKKISAKVGNGQE